MPFLTLFTLLWRNLEGVLWKSWYQRVVGQRLEGQEHRLIMQELITTT
uniref:Uncharacterized protein n=1 Tax=Populus trichocarpa TaxID=3694 RepID=A9PEB7_POPTR|nr:unknown [Populus trichocarpa]